ncbi:uncharacterized protein LOC117534292 isoform X2 [Gymnodraco acuticeps]|uniref:Uncharacterized protein LOC117534292 isoform X2 n=1 Tax=Gymnodraco acuticeps TaxID=8218 RepID=A0A6P8SU10_GYMAC|nr:uncharacterized protein LOC117534292 isoform X2 [Gymnodraco acuticeps]XP_034054384.1 uncharacterized protein LOC117534292 isoform X2 [Gymnodraco acuticeps]
MSSPSSEQDLPVPKVTSEEPVCLSPVQVSRPADKHYGRSYRRKKAQILPMSSPSSEQDSPVPKVTSEEPVCLSTVQVSRPANKHHGKTYRRKKAKSKSKLKVLPMSSPSSLDSPVPKVNQAELLFDQIFHSSPTHSSGLPEGAELQMSQVQKYMFGGDLSSIPKEGFGSGRKRSALDSGYLSDQTKGPLGKTRREEPEAKGEEPVSEGEGVEGEEPVSEGEAPEWEEPEPKREEPETEGEELWEEPETEREEPNSLQTESSPEGAGPVGWVEPGSHLTYNITAAFNTFNSQLDHHFTGCWKNVETEILQSLTKSQQHVSSPLTAVHQHRLVLLHRFQSSVTDQLKSLHDDSNRLTSINTQTLNFFQTEMQQLGSFCEETLTILRSLGGGESGAGHPSSQ